MERSQRDECNAGPQRAFTTEPKALDSEHRKPHSHSKIASNLQLMCGVLRNEVHPIRIVFSRWIGRDEVRQTQNELDEYHRPSDPRITPTIPPVGVGDFSIFGLLLRLMQPN